MRGQKMNLLDEKLSSQYTDVDTFLVCIRGNGNCADGERRNK